MGLNKGGVSTAEFKKLTEAFGKDRAQEIARNSLIAKTDKDLLEELDPERDLKKLREFYCSTMAILRKYCDLEEENYNIIALWIIGTHFHKEFPTFPYLFFNAMKGSGKSRLLRIIAKLAKNGRHLAGINDTTIFRLASQSTFCIDEFESVGNKEKQAVRELLNVGYKKGMSVIRHKKVRDEEGEGYEPEEFDLYCPIAMANITGMDNVLEDRCITLILERSNNANITNLMETFDYDPLFINMPNLGSLGSGDALKNIYMEWNDNISTNISNYTNYTNSLLLPFFNKIKKSDIDGRNLELFMPLFLISNTLVDSLFDITLETAMNIVKSKKEEDSIESRDHQFLDFIATGLFETGLVGISKITNDFRAFLNEDNESMKDINNKWVGRALRRHNLRIEHRKRNGSVMVKVNVGKARNKILMFTTNRWDGLERRKESKPVEEDRRKIVPQ